MWRYFLRRTWQSVIVLFIVTLFVFFTMHSMPGNPVALYLGPTATTQQIQYYSKQFGFDKPVIVQYYKWVTGLFKGRMGRSIAFQRKIKGLLFQRIGVTLSITVPALILSVILGIIFGLVAAFKRGSAVDTFITSTANLGIATPNFWLAILGIYLFGLKLGWLPVLGYTPLTHNLGMGVRKLIMPVLVLALGPTVGFTRQTRAAVLEVIRQDFVRTARSKGLGELAVMTRHVLRNAFIPILTLMGLSVGNLLGGTIIVEQIFVIPGVGRLMMTAILDKDYLVVQDVVFVVAVAIILSNLAVDVLYGFVDPRIRIEQKKR